MNSATVISTMLLSLIIFVTAQTPTKIVKKGKTTCTFYALSERGQRAACTSDNISKIQNLLPIDVVYLRVSRTPTRMLKADIFSKLLRLKTLILKSNGIELIETSAFRNLKNLTMLDLSENRISALHAGIFGDGIPALKTLDLSSNPLNISTVVKFVCVLKNLRVLTIDRIQVDLIFDVTLDPLKQINLEVLSLRRSGIKWVNIEAFTGVRHSLKELYIDGNEQRNDQQFLYNLLYGLRNSSLKVLSATSMNFGKEALVKALKNLAAMNLEELDLSGNILTLDRHHDLEEPLPMVKHLTKLRLNNCQMEELLPNFSDIFPNLKHFEMDKNMLSEVPPSVGHLLELEVLSMRQASQTKKTFGVPVRTFENLTQMRVLNMDENMLPKLENSAFVGLTNLRVLHLSSCSIDYIAANAFRCMESLEELYLSDNRLSLNDAMFIGLRNLKSLFLKSAVAQTKDARHPFNDMQKLQVLDLSKNSLKTNDLDILETLKNLTTLMLNDNDITTWNRRFTVFHQTKNLSYVTLDNNVIKTVNNEMVSDLSNVRKLRLNPNPFDCDLCDTLTLQNWLNDIRKDKTRVRLVHGVTWAANCTSPKALAGKDILALDLPLDHCIHSFVPVIAAVSSCIVFVALTAFLVHRFRWYIRYWIFWIRSRVKRYKEFVDEHEYQYDAFISYSQQDFPWVQDFLLPTIETPDSGLRLCIHDRDFQVGTIISDNIFSAIDDSRKTVLLLSNDFLKSRWCIFELHMAQHKLFDDSRDSLIIVGLSELDEQLMDSNIKYLCHTRTYLKWTDEEYAQRYFWERLQKAISKPLTSMECVRFP